MGQGAGLGAPDRLPYLWHLFFEPQDATEMEVTFTALGGGTSVRLEQRGFERLGEAGAARRAKTETAWLALSGEFVASAQSSADGS